MGQTTLSVRMDEEVKKQFDEYCADFGLNTSAAINMFARTVIREKRIPFEIRLSSDPFYEPTNQGRLIKSVRALNSGKGKTHDLIEDKE